MRIGILTHPQTINYGGILQCYALYTVLSKMGHEPVVIQRCVDKSFFLWEWLRSFLKKVHFPRYYDKLDEIDRAKNIRSFVNKEIACTSPICSRSKLRKVCSDYNLDAVIVGSDQVWRKDFAMKYSYDYFLDFVPNGVKKMSYAASFGLSCWQYNEQETLRIKDLMSSFSGISVREKDAIDLLKFHTGLNATQHIDPTLLLPLDEYMKISSDRLCDDDYIFVYWMGQKDMVEPRINLLKDKGMKVISVFLRDVKEHVSVEDWLSYIRYAKYVITDSFHGTIFSIIFEKTFELYKNDSGGNGRLISLFATLAIKEGNSIDYSTIKTNLEKLQVLAKEYLVKSLTK